MAEFGENIEFAKFLLMAKTDKAFGDSLISQRNAVVDSFPGLSGKEKETLKVIDWKGTTVDIPDNILREFNPKTDAQICVKTVGPLYATESCSL